MTRAVAYSRAELERLVAAFVGITLPARQPATHAARGCALEALGVFLAAYPAARAEFFAGEPTHWAPPAPRTVGEAFDRLMRQHRTESH